MEGFSHPNQVPEYLLTEPDIESISYGIVGKQGCFGIAWSILWLNFESYVSDIEPEIPLGKLRIVMWQRIARTDKPTGWHDFFGTKNSDMGIAEIHDPERYWQNWTGDARRNRSRFLKDKRFTIEKVSFEDYIMAYEKIEGFDKIRPRFIRRMRKKAAVFSSTLDYVVAKERSTGKVFGGLATLDLPSISQSIHHNAFLDHKTPHSSVGTGLVDYWFGSSIKKGIRFLNFGVFWSPGEPKSWKGFSRFKAQFGVHMIRFPRTLVRLA